MLVSSDIVFETIGIDQRKSHVFCVFRAINWYKILFFAYQWQFCKIFQIFTLLEDRMRDRLCMRPFYWYGTRITYQDLARAWIMGSVAVFVGILQESSTQSNYVIILHTYGDTSMYGFSENTADVGGLEDQIGGIAHLVSFEGFLFQRLVFEANFGSWGIKIIQPHSSSSLLCGSRVQSSNYFYFFQSNITKFYLAIFTH